MDYTLFAFVHQFVNKSPFLDGLMVFLATPLLPIVAIVFVIWYLVLASLGRDSMVPILALLSGGLSKFIEFSFDMISYFPRPFVTLGFQPLVSMDPLETSFPSGHTSFMFALAFFVLLTKYEFNEIRMSKKWCVALFVLALLVGLARVYVGVHWPLDVLGGIFVGFIAAALVAVAQKHFFHHVIS